MSAFDFVTHFRGEAAPGGADLIAIDGTDRFLLDEAPHVHGDALRHPGTVAIVDDRYGLLGSANFDLRSLFVNFEIGVMVYSESDAQAMKQWALQLLSRCQAPAAVRSRRARMFGNVAEELSRLLAPLL